LDAGRIKFLPFNQKKISSRLCNRWFFVIQYQNLRMRFFYALAILLMASHTICFSQTVSIRGKVKTNVDSVLTGASVSIKGTSIISVTNSKGEFAITVRKFPATLIFSFVGYKSKEFVLKKADSSKYLAIKLNPLEMELSEVVVVGYGTARKRDLTGSVPVTRSESYASKAVEERSAGLMSSHKAAERRSAFAGVPRDGGSYEVRAHSKVLTAGELSDFKKWKLWEGYTKDEFRQWSEHWGIAPVNRYCVQVQNEDGNGIAGEKIYLIDLNTRDTVWRAISDNTGKAELWANFTAADSSQRNFAIVCRTESKRFPVSFENGINRITLKRECGHSNIADIAFVVDATGSMKDEIKYLQDELQDVIGHIAVKNKGVELRLASVFYRDHKDQYLTRSIDFQNDAAPLIQFIEKQSADGGDDYPEAVEDALTTALDSLHWDLGARAKIIFLILDAPPHDAARDKMEKLMMQAAAMGVRIVPVVCSGIDKSTEYLMRSIALATNGSYVFLTDDSGVGDKHIKPTTDHFKVELLNDLLQRLVSEMIFIPACRNKDNPDVPVNTDSIAKLVVYPNPTTGKIQIRSTENIKELYLTDFTGKILEKININGKSREWKVDLRNYPSGTYLLRYFTEEKGWGAEKVLLIK
jgi:hypothetical protein